MSIRSSLSERSFGRYGQGFPSLTMLAIHPNLIIRTSRCDEVKFSRAFVPRGVRRLIRAMYSTDYAFGQQQASSSPFKTIEVASLDWAVVEVILCIKSARVIERGMVLHKLYRISSV